MSKKKPLSRQRQYQLRKEAEGLCIKCGKPRDPDSATWCLFHKLEHRRIMRERNGNKPWRPGGVGRPPKGAT